MLQYSSPISPAAVVQDDKGTHGGPPPPPSKHSTSVTRPAKAPSMQVLKRELAGLGAPAVELNDINMKELRKLHHEYNSAYPA
jgi:hypothetical protein|eukprot:COSAG01_NODE_1239_length_11087_cov_7.928376_4_plen_83_part_00